ncbi:MAG: MBL fold metallo-hydrolase [Gemmatimonadetes bacterium]|nr:MBL fold metallo-hydrolase [Gemmatimonadota bacterium]
MDGTRTYLVGTGRVAVVDPGPDISQHLDDIVAGLEGAEAVTVLLTHEHGDHAGGAPALADRLGIDTWGPGGSRALEDGMSFETELGTLRAVATPGHTEEHYCFHLESLGAVFVGDLLLGRGDTTWIGEYRGGVADYLESLDRLEELGPRTLYPGHGPPLSDPAEAIGRFRAHRRARIDQVRQVLASSPSASVDEVLGVVYADVPEALWGPARRSVEAILDYLKP